MHSRCIFAPEQKVYDLKMKGRKKIHVKIISNWRDREETAHTYIHRIEKMG